MPDYRTIYNDVISTNEAYNNAENSPGFQTCVRHAHRIQALAGRSLDVGCGVGFVCNYLSKAPFQFGVYGVDVSDQAIERTRKRLTDLNSRDPSRFQRIENCTLPFPDEYFNLVTCFDVMEHLDIPDIGKMLEEIDRVTMKGGLQFLSVSCREAGSNDLFGDNLHRSVQGVDWWLDQAEPDEATFEAHICQLTMWKHKSFNS